MIFRSFGYFLEFPEKEINPENELLRQQCVRVTSVVNGAGLGQTDLWALRVSS